MWCVKPLCCLFLLVNPATFAIAAQESGPPRALGEPDEGQVSGADEELFDDDLIQALLIEQSAFEVVNNRYINAEAGYGFELRELRKAEANRSDYPQHPRHEYMPVFQTLAKDGNGPAALWLIENAAQLVPEIEKRTQFYKLYFTQLATEHATGKYIKDAFELLLILKPALGEPFVLATLRTIGERSLRRETIAKALYFEAQVLMAKGGAADPERKAKANELYRMVIDGYAGTKAGTMAGTPLLKDLLESMRDSQGRWLTAARQKIAAGEDPSSWGHFPYSEVQPLIETIAGAEHPPAQFWAYRIFPAMDQAARESAGAAIVAELGWLSERFGNSNVKWMAHKFDLLDFVYSVYPNDHFTFASVEDLGKNVFYTDPQHTIGALDTLLAHTTDDRIRGEAQLVLAQALARTRTLKELERGMRMFEAARTTAPIERQRKEATAIGVRFKWAMPGMVHPTLNLTDSMGAPISTNSYQGKILVLYFWTLTIPGSAKDLVFVNELQKRYSPESFKILGLNCQSMDRRGFRKVAAKHKITWRNALLQQRNNPVTHSLWVSLFPQIIVIDAQGVIRGRGMTHEQTTTLIDDLLAEMELAESPTELAAAGLGSLSGLVRFSGSTKPLDPIVLTDEQRQACDARGGSTDMKNRTRLVSTKGGLANVVIAVRVPGVTASGLGGRMRTEQVNCRYEPHVLVVPQGTLLEINNEDKILHGASAHSLNNTSFNVVLRPGGRYSTNLNAVDRFELTSDTHTWMSSWVVVTDTPYYAISGKQGEFSLPNLPVGKYVADWWHESLGKGQSVEFEIKAGEATRIEWSIGAE